MRIFDKNGNLASGNFSAFSDVIDILSFFGAEDTHVLVDMSSHQEVEDETAVDDIDDGSDYRLFPSPGLVKITVNGRDFYFIAGDTTVVAVIKDRFPSTLDFSQLENFGAFTTSQVFTLRTKESVMNTDDAFYVQVAGAAPIKIQNRSGNAMEIVAKSGYTAGVSYLYDGITYDSIERVPTIIPGSTIHLVSRVTGNAASTTVYFVIAGSAAESVVISENKSIDAIVEGDGVLKSKFKNGSVWKYTTRIDGMTREPGHVIESGVKESVMVILTEVIKGNNLQELIAAASKATGKYKRELNREINRRLGKRA